MEVTRRRAWKPEYEWSSWYTDKAFLKMMIIGGALVYKRNSCCSIGEEQIGEERRGELFGEALVINE